MEKEINIAEILKDKPLDIKLWTDIFGEVTLDYVSKNGNGFNVKHHHGVLDKFLPNGKMYEEGTLCIYPSRNMRDWRKFAWKKGDVLVSNGEYIIFEKWKNNSYTTFLGLFDSIDNNSLICLTSVWEKETNEVQINKYISQIEKDGGGKLNLETLEIEKPKFKDGDVVFYEDSEHTEVCSSIFIFRGKQNHTPRFLYHAVLDSDGFFNAKDGSFGIYEGKLRLATEEEKQQLFGALEKENKAWDAVKKAIVDLPKKCEFKALDYILIKNNFGMWELHQFAFYNRNTIVTLGGCTYSGKLPIIPYNDQTAHLLGTTDDWKGGEE